MLRHGPADRPVEVPGREQTGRVGAERPWPTAVGVAEQLVLPGTDPAGRVEACVESNRHRRAERFPAVLVGALPDDGDRRARLGEGDERSVEGGVVGAVVPIAAGTFDVPHGHVLDSELDHVGERSRRSASTFWLWLHTWRCCSSQCATAADGAIDACIVNGLE